MSVQPAVVKVVILYGSCEDRPLVYRYGSIGVVGYFLFCCGNHISVSNVSLVPPTERMIQVPLTLLPPTLRELHVVTRSPQ